MRFQGLYLPIFILLSLIVVACQEDDGSSKEVETLGVMTFNLRYDNQGDSLNWWGYRKDSVLNLLNNEKPEVIGFQEVLHNQLNDLLEGLDGYASIGVGREDGDKAGEYVPILYDTRRLEALESGYFWLSETPDKPSFGWDAACHRISTWAKFRQKDSDRSFYFLNTHFDHRGDTARIMSTKMIRDKVSEYASDGLPVIVVGDFNAHPESDVVLGLMNVEEEGSLQDAYLNSQERNEGGWTFHDFGALPLQDRQRIDYVFYNGNLTPLKHTTFQELDVEGRVYLSDHTPIQVIFQIDE